jgi:hypothetical protein
MEERVIDSGEANLSFALDALDEMRVVIADPTRKTPYYCIGKREKYGVKKLRPNKGRGIQAPPPSVTLM